MTDLWSLLDTAAAAEASDLHLCPGSRPAMRCHGALVNLETPALDDKALWALMNDALDESQRRVLDERRSLEIVLTRDDTRVRLRAAMSDSGLSAALRRLPTRLPTLAELGIDPELYDPDSPRGGLVVLGGARGSGRSTTAHALLAHLDATRTEDIVIVETPPEYLHPRGRGTVAYRQVGIDSPSHRDALEAAATSLASVVYVDGIHAEGLHGSTRHDGPALAAALELAGTGRLVLLTLLAADVRACLELLWSTLPSTRERAAALMARTLRGVVAQRLIPTTDGPRQCITEQLVAGTAVRRTLDELSTATSPRDVDLTALRPPVSFAATVATLLDAGTISAAEAARHAPAHQRLAR